MSLVEIQNLTRRFGDLDAVVDLTFAFDAGRITGFIGPNGAGKSTTMRILAGLDVPSEGRARVGGFCTVADFDQVHRLVGYMPDSYGAYPDMTVFEYLDFFARAYGLATDARRRAMADVIELCHLGDLQEKLVTSLSKGMRQRLCLGRCLVHDPAVLIMDEPAAGLDPRARIELKEVMRILAAQGKGILVSSHILADLEEICDSVAIIEAGRLVASGTVSQVKKRAAARRAQMATSEHAHHGMLQIRLAEPHPRLLEILLQQPDLTDVATTQTGASAVVGGDDASRAALLARLVQAGLPVCAFDVREENLEDLFLHLTEGRVQ